MSHASNQLAVFSAYLDGKIGARLQAMTPTELRSELLLMHRTIKVGEEVGEAIEKLIGLTGANPRKGIAATEEDLVEELLDAAVAVLGAVESITGNQGTALDRLAAKIGAVYDRARLGAQ